MLLLAKDLTTQQRMHISSLEQQLNKYRNECLNSVYCRLAVTIAVLVLAIVWIKFKWLHHVKLSIDNLSKRCCKKFMYMYNNFLFSNILISLHLIDIIYNINCKY